ncbi:hypothetical protein [Bacillus toyonensis]|uniref:hypothetical protein n=1 Tax=Bacillus toyonensis TaxID=155322 RepID=UPI000BF01EBF|nr:hypothetical protein [Bacillus toyonensis]NKW96661.1 hypothetical protein [Bacillus toyonensis]PEJ00578.1 hypothetical protein CN671_19515 [Bacillus toyonensis]
MKYKYLIDRINIKWIYQILSIVEYKIPIEEVVEISRDEGIDFGTRRDVFNRLVDLGLLIKSREDTTSYIDLTEFGHKVKNIYIKNQSKIPIILHMLHILQSFKKESQRYFSTYYYTTKISLEDKKSSKDQYSKLIKLLEERFSEEDSITGLDGTTIGKANVFLSELLDDEYNYLTFIDPIIFAYGLQGYMKARTGDRLGNILITNKEKEEISILFLISPNQIENMLEKANRYTRSFEMRYSTTGIILNSLKPIEL